MKVLISWMAYNRDFRPEPLQVDPKAFTGTLHREIYKDYGFEKHILLASKSNSQELARKCYIMKEFIKDQYSSHSVEIKEVGFTESQLQDFGMMESAIRSFLQQLDASHQLYVVAGSGPTTLSMVWASLRISMQERFRLFLMQRPEHTEGKKRHALIEVSPYANLRLDKKLMEYHFNQDLPPNIYVDDCVRGEYEKAGMIARASDINVLILGETGCGKDVLAKYIHEQSPLFGKAYMAINCASLQDSLLYSELFGHEKGAFTGADKAHMGLFERCADGTLFLDEIGDISPYMQQSLLRALENKEIKRAGANEVIQGIQVRIIAATNHNLYEKCKEGKFRWDLYYRLCTMEIYLEPYRSRTLEQRRLALQHYMDLTAKKWGRTLSLEATAKSILEQYAFPGNFREIYNTLNGLFSLGKEVITVDCLPKRFFDGQAHLDETYEGVLRQHCLRMYQKYNQNLAKACKALGYKNSTQMRRKFQSWGIEC